MREWAADHRPALGTIVLAVAVLLGLGWLHGRAMGWPLWHGEFCSLANGVTDGCDVPPATHYAYLVSALEYVTVVPLLAATFSLFTSRATVRHVRRHIDRRLDEQPPVTISMKSRGGMDDALMRVIRAQAARKGPAVMTTRIMGDATHNGVAQLAAIRARLQLVLGYDTGTADIDWTPADVAQFPGIPVGMIDQGFTGSPNLKATVRDVEFGAWSPGQAVNRAGWNVPRPTIYCTLRETGYGLLTTPGVLADGWQGDLWLSIPGWKVGDPLPATPGCTVVAVQNDFTNPNYDLSVVLDPTWPEEAVMPPIVLPGVPGFWLSVQILSSADGSKQVAIGLGTDGELWQSVRSGGVWGATTPL